MPRLFIALPIENEVKEELKPVYNYLNQKNHVLKTVPPNNYHFTLKFLGDCKEALAQEIINHFDELLYDHKKIPYILSGMGVFPDLKRANVVWVGLKSEKKILENLQKNVETFASQFGFKEENRKFVPHLTLARIRKGKTMDEELMKYIDKNSETFYIESTFKRLVLFSSILKPDGPVYAEEKSILLPHCNC